MKLSSISGVIYKVKDPTKTAAFYEDLGFTVTKSEGETTSVRLNWFWVEFVTAGTHESTGGNGQFLYVSVPDVESAYKTLEEKSLHPTAVKDFESGRRETMISDPDGYKIVFFQKLK